MNKIKTEEYPSIVITNLPRAGLGNKLFVWAKSLVFSNLNEIDYFIYGWNKFMLGPYLRLEKSKRRYTGYFRKKNNNFDALLKYAQYFFNRKVWNPELEKCPPSELNKKTVFSFSLKIDWRDYFKDLKAHRPYIINKFNEELSDRVLQSLKNKKKPTIGIHIRMGDFRILEKGEDFKNAGLVRTPLNYFADLVKNIRKECRQDLAVTIFTNGSKQELGEILELGNITIEENNSDIVDLILLSYSKVIICSAGSTFSYWAAFLSEAIVLHHPYHYHSDIRPEVINKSVYEGIFSLNEQQLVYNLKLITEQKIIHK